MRAKATVAKATVVCDMQFGSTGKGLIAGYLAVTEKPDVVMTAWSMNAGHTYIDQKGNKFVHCMLANGVVSPNLRFILIGPGSQIGLDRLFKECEECAYLLGGVTILIHENACIISQRHIDEEQGPMTKIGSTKKGCGAALIEKIRRSPEDRITAGRWCEEIDNFAEDKGIDIRVSTHDYYCYVIEKAGRILVEGAQGYSLGMNSGFYPYTTSRECTPAQIASDTLLPLPMIGNVVGTMRTYPIRVANRFNEHGEMVGWSGPCYNDQREISFNDLGQATELTTVTQLPRRIFTFSPTQLNQAMRTVRPDRIFLNFINYLNDKDHALSLMDTIDQCAQVYGKGGVAWVGNGPAHDNVIHANRFRFWA